MKKIPVADATPAQLRHFAEVVLGLDGIKKTDTSTALRAKIAVVYKGDTITVAEDEPEAADPAPVAAAPAVPVSDELGANGLAGGVINGNPAFKHKRVYIYGSEKPGGKEPVPLNVNGRQMYAPREQIIILAEPYIECLRNAREMVYDQDQKTGEMTSREVLAHTFEVRGEATAEEAREQNKAASASARAAA
jgi:hypothetical protein